MIISKYSMRLLSNRFNILYISKYNKLDKPYKTTNPPSPILYKCLNPSDKSITTIIINNTHKIKAFSNK